MEEKVKQLIEYIQSVIQTCEDADRKMLAEETSSHHCPMKDGYSGSFDFDYLNTYHGGHKVRGEFEYYDTGLGIFQEHIYKSKIPFPSLSFLTEVMYKSVVIPAITIWLEKKVQNEPFGGLYRARFRLRILMEEEGEFRYRNYINVFDPKREEAQREMIRSFVQNKDYQTMNLQSDECESVISDILQTLPTFFGEFPVEVLKEAIAIITQKYRKADPWSFSIAVLYPLTGACMSRLKRRNMNRPGPENRILADEAISEEELDFIGWIALQIIRNADDSHMRDNGESILYQLEREGLVKAMDYLKYGTGEIDKEYTRLKTPKVYAAANDIKRIIKFKVKEEDAESYGIMLEFIINLLKRGFPSDFQIKINSRLNNFIPVRGLNKQSKTNLFFGNAATFPELWGKMTEYVRTILDEFTYYSDSTGEEAVTVGGYAVYALGTTNLEANAEIVNEFLAQVDFEHDMTARNFVEEYMDKETAKKYGLDDSLNEKN